MKTGATLIAAVFLIFHLKFLHGKKIEENLEKLDYYVTVNYKGRCGGALISDRFVKLNQFYYGFKKEFRNGNRLTFEGFLFSRFVITSAHCLVFNKKLKNQVQVKFKNTKNRKIYSFKVKLSSTITHENFHHPTLENDIALIELPKKVRLKPLQLPTKQNLMDQLVEVPNFHKKSLKFNVISNEKCSIDYKIEIPSTELCAEGVRGASVCDGNSGSPLLLQNTNVLVGIVSYFHGKSCKNKGPSGFARVSSFVEWIARKIE